VTSFSPFAARPLDPIDYPAAIDLAIGAGVQGVYIANVLMVSPTDGRLLGLHGAEELLGLVYFGSRGNLLVLERETLDPKQLAVAIMESAWQWRIALGPAAVIGELVALGKLHPIVNRPQIYYGVTLQQLSPAASSDGVRTAVRRDLKLLMEASLHLNETDLLVQPWRVDRDWLRRNTRTRIKEGSTYLLGPVGQPVCKLDIGSRGPAGVVIEGVYTWPSKRSMGEATRLVAGVAATVLHEHRMVCLHVAADNIPARRAYEKCGMQELATCQLVLRD